MPFCPACIRERFDQISLNVSEIHARTRKEYGLPEKIPREKSRTACQLCVNKCSIAEGESGYCGVRQNANGTVSGPDRDWAYADWYHDPLPTNCVADWVCKGHTDHGNRNLAVFYEACTFNCLFCQNWHFRDRKNKVLTKDMVSAADSTTGCVCFFGGDPTPFALHSLEVAKRIGEKVKSRRICWETNGSINPKYMKKWCDHALTSGGCIKIDLKTFSETLNIALCGVSNENTKENIRIVAEYRKQREQPPMLIVSTLLIPGYIDKYEITSMAEFLVSIDKTIPWSFLGFYPHFQLNDMESTSRAQAEMALDIARAYGIVNTHLGNIHLIH